MKTILKVIFVSALLFSFNTKAQVQDTFSYTLLIEEVHIPNMPGIHSFAFGVHNGKWLILGGRRDGLHARQPFNAFPQAFNNTDIFVVDPASGQVWSSSVSSLPTAIAEQLQSTNMIFHQQGDTLVFIGGYGFSPTANNHITFPRITTLQVSGLVQAVMQNTSILPYFKSVEDVRFAVNGGQMGLLNNTFYMVGGHRFDGRYNPMGNPTYTQTYTHQVRKFKIDHSTNTPTISHYTTFTDALHLHRRDYNLLPQVFPNGELGFTISSGVFQPQVDLPYLYPVDIRDTGIQPITTFNQYLSNYHGAKVALYDSTFNQMSSLFFGGLSQYYYQNGQLIQDNNVPFVKTISRVSRYADGSLQEYVLPMEMPGYKGASAEFIPNSDLKMYENEVIALHRNLQDTLLLGHVVGGIASNTLNPFTANQTATQTRADTSVFTVKLIRNQSLKSEAVEVVNPYRMKVFPNPADEGFSIQLNIPNPEKAYYFLSDSKGALLQSGNLMEHQQDFGSFYVKTKNLSRQIVTLTVVLDHRHFLTQKIILK